VVVVGWEQLSGIYNSHHVMAESSLVPRLSVGVKGEPGAHCLHMRQNSQKSGKMVNSCILNIVELPHRYGTARLLSYRLQTMISLSSR